MLQTDDLIKGKYKVLETIGEGSYGTVYLVEGLQNQCSKWAVKEIAEMELPPGERKDAVRLFKKEAEILKSLRHSGIPAMSDYFSITGCHYLTMEYINGVSLDEMMLNNGNACSPGEIIPWAMQLAAILDYLHTQSPCPVIFRDLKPSNIMLTDDGMVKLIDFGIARHFNPQKIKDTFFMGTPGFSAPEQYGSGQSDIRTDIFSFGATFYYLLSNKDMPPFRFKFPPLREFSPKVPAWFEKIIMRCLAVNPGERYQSAAELLKDLEAGQRDSYRENYIKESTLRPPSRPSRAVQKVSFITTRKSFVSTWKSIISSWKPVITRPYFIVGSILLALILIFALLIPAVKSSQEYHLLDRCTRNMKNLGTACEMYSTDDHGRYPQALESLSPQYLKTIPFCPASKRSYGYVFTTIPDMYTITCAAPAHKLDKKMKKTLGKPRDPYGTPSFTRDRQGIHYDSLYGICEP